MECPIKPGDKAQWVGIGKPFIVKNVKHLEGTRFEIWDGSGVVWMWNISIKHDWKHTPGNSLMRKLYASR